MRKLSSGDDSTLGNYRQLIIVLFDGDNEAIKFLDRKIAESPNGENEEVLADESQMLFALGTMAMKGGE